MAVASKTGMEARKRKRPVLIELGSEDYVAVQSPSDRESAAVPAQSVLRVNTSLSSPSGDAGGGQSEVGRLYVVGNGRQKTGRSQKR